MERREFESLRSLEKFEAYCEMEELAGLYARKVKELEDELKKALLLAKIS